MLICKNQHAPHPKIEQTLICAENCDIHVFVHDFQVYHLGKYKIPSFINDTNELDILLNHLRMTYATQNNVKQSSVVTLNQLLLSLLSLTQDESYKYFSVVKFVSEQLMTRKLECSADLSIFSSPFYSCSPKAYRFLRENISNITKLQNYRKDPHFKDFYS